MSNNRSSSINDKISKTQLRLQMEAIRRAYLQELREIDKLDFDRLPAALKAYFESVRRGRWQAVRAIERAYKLKPAKKTK